MPITLGLDLGPSSLGWALVDEAAKQIVDAGVRVFPEGVDNFDTSKEASRNEQRRLARQMRRQHRRRGSRKRLLRDALVSLGLLPADSVVLRQVLETDPYALRAKALTEKLRPHELGRVIYHLNQRRGFLSLSKREKTGADAKEIKGMLGEIEQLDRELAAAGHETVGALLHEKANALVHTSRCEDDHVRRRHLSRFQLEAELDLIWERQRGFGHDLLTDELKYGRIGRQVYPAKPIRQGENESPLRAFGLHGIIFFQRPIYWPASVVGRCELEPRYRRCPRADRAAQKFRLLQEVNNLRYIDPEERIELPLDAGQRQLLIEKLSTAKERTFDQVRKALGFLDSVQFNLERGKRSKLKGMITDAILAEKKHVGPTWHKLDERMKDRIVRNLIERTDREEVIERRLVERYGLTREQAEGAVSANLPSGYGDVSLNAINRLLPHLEKGLKLMGNDRNDSAVHAAGYLRPDQRHSDVFDQLPALDDRTCPMPAIPNPVVRRALVELRRVVNAIVREYGKPDAIHLEMARDVQQGSKARKDYSSRIREREEARSDAADEIRKMGQKVTGEKILRYLLWLEQGRECLYTGQPISQAQLFGGATEIDHILPYSQSLDNAQSNKALVFREANRDKGQRTIHGWLAAIAPERFDAICQRARSHRLPFAKYRKIIQKEARQDEFIARQLTDTGYIARATGQYLRCLYEQPHHVLGLKGQLTAELRRQWGLEHLLSELPDSPAWDEQSRLRPGEKNRADHRHHAVDAIVVALTNRSRLQQLARGLQECEHINRETGEVTARQTYRGGGLQEPWVDFQDSARACLGEINVSHRSERKIAGKLHEETLYGPTEDEGTWVVRKPVETLSLNEIPMIRDGGVRRLVEQRLATIGVEPGRGRKVDSKTLKEALSELRMPSGVPVKKVRVLRKEQTIQAIRSSGGDAAYVKPGSTHHLCIFEWSEGARIKRDAVFVTMLEAISRIRQKQAVIQRTPPTGHPTIPPDARFIMSLSRGEMVQGPKGGGDLCVFNTAASTQGQIYFYPNADARKAADRAKFAVSANSMSREARKVTVDPLGRVRWAGD